MLLINGVRQTNEVNVKETLDKADGGEGDTMLVLSSSLVGQDEARVKVAVPMAAWQDNKYFFRGFILFRENKVKLLKLNLDCFYLLIIEME